MIKLRLLKLLGLSICALFITSCGSKLTSDKVSHVKSGMSTAEVMTLLGKPTEKNSQSISGISGTTYVYRSGHSEVKIVFLNDKVTAVQSHLQ